MLLSMNCSLTFNSFFKCFKRKDHLCGEKTLKIVPNKSTFCNSIFNSEYSVELRYLVVQ